MPRPFLVLNSIRTSKICPVNHGTPLVCGLHLDKIGKKTYNEDKRLSWPFLAGMPTVARQTNTADSGTTGEPMQQSKTFWELIDHFLEVIPAETGFPVVIYDTEGYIIKATDASRIGDLHAGAEKIMKSGAPDYAITTTEAENNPLVKEGVSFPIRRGGKIVAGFGITGKLEQVTAIARIASKTIQAWVNEQNYLRKLERSELRYRNIFNHSLHGIFQTTAEGSLITANPQLAKILGYHSVEELLQAGTNVASQLYVFPEDRQRLLAIIQDQGQVSGFITRLYRKDGTVIDAKINASAIFDKEYKTTLTEGFLEDITERKKAEEAIRFSEEKFSKAFDSCPVWVVMSSLATGRYIDVNQSFLNIMGFRRDEVINRTSYELGTWLYPEERETVLREINKHGSISNYEVSRRTKNGTILNMLFWGDIIEVGGETCLLSVSLDITEKVAAEQERQELERVLAHARKMDAIGQLVGGIAHDFNNMLGGIMGAAEMLELHLPEGSKALKFQKMIFDTASRSADLTRKLLAFSRTSPTVASTVVDIHDVLRETVIILQNTIDKRIQLVVDLRAEVCKVAGDPSQLHNALLNLGINSSQAMPDGGKISFITSIQEAAETTYPAADLPLEPGDFLEIKVTDTGCGIPPENLGKIFDPFFTTKEQGKGTGLGLAALYGTVQQHHGTIKVDSEVGSGTCFTILLPLADEDREVAEIKPLKKTGSGHILVVDDEEVMRLTARAILEDLGYTVETAENGDEALQVYSASSPFDVVILDMVMPVMNGRDCLEKLLRIDPSAKVILSSGFTQEDDLTEMKKIGLKNFIRKPYRSSELNQVVHKTLKEDK